MSKKHSFRSAKAPFEETVLSCAKLCGTVLPFIYDSMPGSQRLHAAQARRVVALAFMNIVSAWEEFVQSSFIRYMTGAVPLSGDGPKLRLGPCQTLVHAGQVLKQRSDFDFESKYISWSNWSQVVDRAKIFFEAGLPFSAVNGADKKHVEDAFKIRNRVAHSSVKCRAEFVEVAKRHLGIPLAGKLKQGYDVGALLLTSPKLFGAKCERKINYMAFVDLFLKLGNIIVPTPNLAAAAEEIPTADY